MKYAIRVVNEMEECVVKTFSDFGELIRFMVGITYLWNGNETLLYGNNIPGYKGLRNKVLEGYNRSGKDHDKDGNIKRFRIVDENLSVVDPYNIWDALLARKESVKTMGALKSRRFLRDVERGTLPVKKEEFVHVFKYRRDPVPHTGKWYGSFTPGRYNSGMRTLRLLSDAEYAEYSTNARKDAKKKDFSSGRCCTRCWKATRRHQWKEVR